jgi:regulator of replication initiation timing
MQETSLFETNNLTETNLKMCTSLDTNYDETKVKEIENTDGSKTQLQGIEDNTNTMPCLHNGIVQDLSTLPRDNVTYDQKDDDFKVSDNDNRLNTDMPQCSGEGGTLSTRNYNFLTDESPKVSDNNNRLNIDMPQCSGERGTLSTRDYNFLTNEFPQVKLLNIPVEKNTKNPDVDLCENCNYDDENNVNVIPTLSQNDIEKQNAILTNENAELKTALSKSIAKCEILKLENKRLMESMDQPEILALQARENQESPTIPDNSKSESARIRTVIQHNFVRFVNDLEIRDLCDHLYQHDQITSQDLDELHQLNTKDKRDANRHLLTLIRKRAIPSDILVSALVATKQDGLVHILQKEK